MKDEKFIVLFSKYNLVEGIILYARNEFQAAGKASEKSYLHGGDIVNVIKVEDDNTDIVNDDADNVDDNTDAEPVFLMIDDNVVIEHHKVKDIKSTTIKLLQKCNHFIGSLDGKLPNIKIKTRIESWSETIAFHYYEVEKRK